MGHIDVDRLAGHHQPGNQGHDVLGAKIEVARLDDRERRDQRLCLHLAQSIDAGLLHEIVRHAGRADGERTQRPCRLQRQADFIEGQDVGFQPGNLGLDERTAQRPTHR